MTKILPEQLLALARACPFPLYLVGGSVRDHLCGFPPQKRNDWDLCAAAEEDEFLRAAASCGFAVRSVYRHTGTVKLLDQSGTEYEFTRFRSDRYVRGVHAPSEISFTCDMQVDARRRDFCANAVYYEIARGVYHDPLGGIADIRARIFRTVAPARKVFGEDGLRLMRLARIAAQNGFTPDEECMDGARTWADLILDIAPERIFAELSGILFADGRHGIADAPYRGLCLLRDTGVLSRILPELAAGAGMAQRSDFHAHDVLEHSLRCVRYAPPAIRFAALLHDVGKPFCMARDGTFHAHDREGARLARECMTRWKAPKALTEETAELVLLHMRDFDLRMRESKVRRAIALHYPRFEKLMMLRQADFSACKDDLSPAPAVRKWRGILSKMRAEGAPLGLSELAVGGKEALEAGVAPQKIGEILHTLFLECVQNGAKNNRTYLIKRLSAFAKEETL